MRSIGLLLVLSVAIAGCGGTNATRASVMSGTVLDIDNNPVRDALVSTRFGSTRTSTSGAWELPDQGDGIVEVSAVVDRNGVRYRGRTTAFNFVNERTQSVNIVVGPEDEMGRIRGNVRDRNGDPLMDASVYAYNGAGSSHRTFSDENGNYVFNQLVGGVVYTVLAGGQGYRSDSTDVGLGLSDERVADFVLDEPGLPNLQPPQNVSATSWVSPQDATRKPGDPYEAVKRLLDPQRGSRKAVIGNTRAANGTLVEIDLEWDEQQFPDLLGYGVYRASSASGELAGVDFLPEPLAAYYVDQNVNPTATYSYALTTISSLFPDFPDQTESNLSERVVSRTLGRLNINDVTFDPVRFSWRSGSGATSFTVFVFDEFPSIGVDAFWSSNRVNGTSTVYTGPEDPGTYYFMVVGWANNDESRTISQVGSFQL